MSTGCSKCEASAGHGVIQYQTGCSKCENRLRHESCFIFPYYVLSVCPSLSYLYIYISPLLLLHTPLVLLILHDLEIGNASQSVAGLLGVWWSTWGYLPHLPFLGPTSEQCSNPVISWTIRYIYIYIYNGSGRWITPEAQWSNRPTLKLNLAFKQFMLS